MIHEKITDLIGNTPVLKLDGLYIKLEGFNASGSVKDRPALWMIEGLEKRAPASGGRDCGTDEREHGISLAMIGAAKVIGWFW